MKIPAVAAAVAVALASLPAANAQSAYAQSASTGVSRPDPVEISAQPDEAMQPAPTSAAPVLKPRAGKPMVSSAAGGSETYGAYVPYRPAGGQALVAEATPVDVDAQIVMGVEEKAGELREGTLLRTRTGENLSTVTTAVGTRFTAELTEAVTNAGRVVLPVGAVVEGRVTQVHGGRRISGAAMLHLEPRSVRLPDGTHYAIHAQLIDTDQTAHTKVDGEGSLVRRDHPKETLAVIGGVTGSAATAGALLGGGVGAAVGAGVGAGVGTVVWLKQDRQAVLPRGSELVFSLTDVMEIAPGDAGMGARAAMIGAGSGRE